MKKLSLYIFLSLLFSSSVFAEYGDVYYCNTTKISELKKMGAKSNFHNITFKMFMKKSDDHLGFIEFSDEANGTIVNDHGLGMGLLINTHVKPEQFMAGIGMTKVWFYEKELFISSVYHGDDSSVKRSVISFSQCDKFKE